MAAPNDQNFFKLTGRLVKDPTSVTTPYPHGGTELAHHARVVYVFNPQHDVVEAEEHGQAVVDYVYKAERGVLTTLLREWDPDALAAVFPNVVTGPSSGRPGIDGRILDPTTGSTPTVPGNLASSKSFKLLVSPDAVDYHPALYLPNALPLVAEEAQVQMDMATLFGIQLAFKAALAASGGRTYQFKLLEDIVL